MISISTLHHAFSVSGLDTFGLGQSDRLFRGLASRHGVSLAARRWMQVGGRRGNTTSGEGGQALEPIMLECI